MILDKLLMVCSSQQVTADAVSEDYLDFGDVTPKRNIGTGEPMGYLVVIKVLGTTTGSSKIQAIQSATAGLGSGTQIIGEIDLAAADHAVGAAFIVPISQGIPALRYHGMNFDITGTVDYTVDAFLGRMKDLAIKAQTYAKGYTA